MKKAALLEIIAGTNRGILASETDKKAILSAVAQLEDINPNPRPLEAIELLDGNWRLLYTTSQELLGIDNIPIYKLGQIYQCIRANTSEVFNIGEVIGVPLFEGFVSVAAKFAPVNERRVNVRFERFIFGLQRLIGYQNPTEFIQRIQAGNKFAAVDFSIQNREQKGWLEVTYLDEDLRINRGNEGSVFVLSKERYS